LNRAEKSVLASELNQTEFLCFRNWTALVQNRTLCDCLVKCAVLSVCKSWMIEMFFMFPIFGSNYAVMLPIFYYKNVVNREKITPYCAKVEAFNLFCCDCYIDDFLFIEVYPFF